MTPQSSAEFNKITVECGGVGEERKPHFQCSKSQKYKFSFKSCKKKTFYVLGMLDHYFQKKDAKETSELLRIT